MALLITGDSFVEGVGGSNGGWAQALAAHLPAGTCITIHGIGGQTSDDLLARIDAELTAQPDQVIIAIGANDSRWRPSINAHEVPLERFRANIATLAARVREAGGQVSFVGLASVAEHLTTPFKPDKHYRNEDLRRYDAALRDVAAANHAGYIAAPMLGEIESALADGLHPSDHGHDLILQRVLASIPQ